MRLPIPLVVLLLVFVTLCGLFNKSTPYREPGLMVFQYKFDENGQRIPNVIPDIGAPDERQHANYISHLKSGQGFPVLVPGSPDLFETYQAHQPPLYYLLATGWSAVTGADPEDADAGFRLRFLNSLIGIGTILGIYFAAFWGLGRQDVALAASAFAALLPMNIALHSAISNDPLLYCICTWVLALAIKGLQQGWHFKMAIGIGVLIGLGMLTKTTALVLFPTVITTLYLSHKKHQAPAKPNAMVWTACLVLPLIVAAPWLVRNMNLYGDPLAMSVFKDAFPGSPQASSFIELFGSSGYWMGMVLWWTARSLVGVFGYMDIFMFETLGGEKSGTLYVAILFLLGAVALFGQIGFKKFKDEAEDQSLPQPGGFQIVSLVLLVFTILLFIRFNMQYFQGQARYLFPALASFAFLVGMGAVRLFGNSSKNAWIGVGIFMLLLDFASFSAITNGFEMRQP